MAAENEMVERWLNRREKAYLNKIDASERMDKFYQWEGKSDGSTLRVFCTICKFVSEKDHVCSQSGSGDADTGQAKDHEEAWLGDGLLALDVRVLIQSQIGRIDAGRFVRLTSNAALKAYLRSEGVNLPNTASEARYGTMFESQYRGEFRRRFLENHFGPGAADKASNMIKGMF